MIKEGTAPDLHSYIAMIMIYCRKGEIQQAKKLMTVMREQGFIPTATAYNALLHHYTQIQDTSSVLFTFEDMKANNLVDKFSFGYVLGYLYALGGPNLKRDFQPIVDLMHQLNIQPNIHALNAILSFAAEFGTICCSV